MFSAAIFLVFGAVSMAVMAPFVSTAPALWRELFTGLAAGGCVFALTVVFVRVDRVTLDNVGDAVALRSLQRFLFGSLFCPTAELRLSGIALARD